MYKMKPTNLIFNLRLLVVIVLAISVRSAYSQQTSFTLQEAQDYAAKNSYLMQTAEKEVEKSRKIVDETISIGLPQVNASANYQSYIETPVQLIPSEAIGGTPGEFEEVFFGTEQQMGVAANVNQLIFDGSYFVGLQASKVFLQISEKDKIRSELEIRNMTLVSYGSVLVAERNSEILKNNKENLEQNAFETRQLYENGFVEEQDADQIELLLSTVTNSYEQSIRFLEIAKNQLNFVLGINIGTEVILNDDLDAIVTSSSKVELLTTEFDISSHIDYQIVENQERVSELQWKQQKSTYLPNVSAFYSYQQNSFSNDFDFFNEAPWFPSQIVGLNLNVPLFTSFGRSSRVQQAKIEYEQLNIAKKQVEQQLEINLRNARSVYSFSLSQFKTVEKNLELAEKIYRKTKIKYDEGISSSLDLNQVSNQLLENQTNYVSAALSLIDAKSELNKALNLF